jgi:hypothetical protein
MTKQQLREAIRRIIKAELNEAPLPAVADPGTETEEDVETTPYETPDEDDLRIPKPNVQPGPKAEDIVKKIMARYQASLNEKKIKK